MEVNENMFGFNSFFEGCEKLLEIWFGNDEYGDEENLLDEFDDYQNISTIIRLNEDDEEEKLSNDSGEEESICYFKKSTANTTGNELSSLNKDSYDLRRIPREALEQLLQIVKCEIISSRKSEQIDTYVLSESSLFVSRNRFLIKTCGTTVLLKCLKPLLYLVKEYTSFDKV